MTNLVIGLICLAVGAWGLVAWWEEFGDVLRGFVPLLLVLLGLAAIGAGRLRPPRATPESNHENPAEPDADAAEAVGRRN
jgi:hypothetical protein